MTLILPKASGQGVKVDTASPTYGWRDITIRFACDRTTAWRRWQRALEIVADKLNGCTVVQ